MKLYEIARCYREDIAKLQDLDLDPETVIDTIEGMQGELTEKIKAVVVVAQELEEEAAVRAAHAKRMADSAKSLAARADSLRSYAQVTIQACGVAVPLKYPEFTVSLPKNPQSCEVTDEAALPSHLKTITAEVALAPTFSKTPDDISRALAAAGIGVHGVSLFTKVDKREVLAALKELQGEDKLPGARMNATTYRLAVK